MKQAHILPRFLMAIAGSFISLAIELSACRKIDQVLEETPDLPVEHASQEAKLFTTHPPQHPFVTAIRNRMQRQNGEKPFLKTFIERAGFPRWDKAKVMPCRV